jgi:hypothetical protein
MIERIVEELYISRQKSMKIEQIDPSKSINGEKEQPENIDREIAEYFHSFKKK